MKTVCTAVLGVLLAVGLPSTAAADILGTVDITYSDDAAHDITQVWGAGNVGDLTRGGLYQLGKTAGTGEGDLWPNAHIPAFCIELHEVAPETMLQYDGVMPEYVHNSYLGQAIGTAKADYLRELWGRFYDPSWAAGKPYTIEQNIGAEAFAIAVWEIIYEELPGNPANWNVTHDNTLGDPGFKADYADLTTANNWLHQLDGTGPMADLRAFVYDGWQDYLVQVPEPTSILLLGFGGIVNQERKKKATS